MAKRKRASLKDKNPESLGIKKKGKGIDVLFGGAVDDDDTETTAAQGDLETSDNMTSLPDENSAKASSTDSEANRLVDEFGLPVALEEPPDDLILASSSVEETADGEADIVDPSTSPFALPAAEDAEDDSARDATDLSGILDQENSIEAEEEILSTAEKTDDLSGIEDTAPPETDLSGLIVEEDSSGSVTDTESAAAAPPPEPAPVFDPANDLSGLVTEEPVSPSPVTSQAQPGMASAPAPEYYDPNTAYATPPPAQAAPAPQRQSLQVDQAPAGVVSALSTFAEEIPLTRESFRPEDELSADRDNTLTVSEFQKAEQDEAQIKKVVEYIGPERRENLFKEIEELSARVSDELSGNKKDASFALDTLRQALNLVLEDPREYDEAFYRVMIVKSMLFRKSNLRRWSYTWGIFVLFYGVVWLALCFMGYFVIASNTDVGLLATADTPFLAAVQAMFSGLAGGVGGAVAILWALYYRVSVKQDFDRQYLMWYLVKPILGFVLGLVMYFLLVAASSISLTGAEAAPGFTTATGIAITIFFGFVAGFRQDNVYDWIYVIIKAISPKTPEESQHKTSLVPVQETKVEETRIIKEIP